MSQEHEYAQVLRWLADGEKIQVNVNGWTTLSEVSVLRLILTGTHYKFRLAPRTIRVNGVEVPAPEKVAPEKGSTYFIPDIGVDTFYYKHKWFNDRFDLRNLERGLIYRNTEDAIARAKAMLLTSVESQEARIAELEGQLAAVQQGEQPVAWLAEYVDREGNSAWYVSTTKELAEENDKDGTPRPLYTHPTTQGLDATEQHAEKPEKVNRYCGCCMCLEIDAEHEPSCHRHTTVMQMVPKGWKLVPTIPTLKMQQAALKHVARQHQTRDVYEVMLSAAPKPPDVERLSEYDQTQNV